MAHDHAPSSQHAGTDKEVNLTVFHKWKNINWMANFHSADRDHEDDHKSFTLGGKYRLLKNLKMGLSYSRQYGNRHDDDWDWVPGKWFWQNTEDRGENLVMLDAIPRVLLSFLPGERWVAELRIRYMHNFFNSQNTIKLRPRLTYFWFNEKGPFMNFFLQYEAYLPLNYGGEAVYEKWIYLGALYHFNKWFQPGIYLAKKEVTWETSAVAQAKRASQPYTVHHEANIIGLNLIFKIPD